MGDKLKEIAARVLGISMSEVNNNLKREEGEWDSFNHLLLISEIEKEINVKFTTPEITKIKTFKDLEDIVNNKLK